MKVKKPCALDTACDQHSFIPRNSENAPSKDLPRTQRPSTQNRTQDLPSTDIDVLREQNCHVVRGRQGVCRNVRAEGGQHERECGEEDGRAIVPFVDELKRVPENLAVKNGPCGSHGHSDERAKGECDGNDEYLNVLTVRGQ